MERSISIFLAKSPVITHISTTLNGLSTIRAFQAENVLQAEFEAHQDLNTSAYFMIIGKSLFLKSILLYVFIFFNLQVQSMHLACHLMSWFTFS